MSEPGKREPSSLVEQLWSERNALLDVVRAMLETGQGVRYCIICGKAQAKLGPSLHFDNCPIANPVVQRLVKEA